MNECDYCQRCGRRLTEPCGCKPRDELFYDPASAVWSGVDRAKPGTDRTTLVVHTPNGKDDPLYLKLAEQCIKHGWVILRMEDDGTVYDDMLGALGEGVLRQRVISREEAEAMFPPGPEDWTPEDAEHDATMRSARWTVDAMEQQRRNMRMSNLLQGLANDPSSPLSDDIVRGAYLKPRSARALLDYRLSKLDEPFVLDESTPLRRGEIGKVLGVTVHKTSPAVVGMQSHALADSIKRQRAERKRQSQAELAKIRKRKGGY